MVMDKETETTINRLLADNKAAHDLNDYLTKENKRLREENDELKDLLQCTVNYTGASVSSNRFTFHAALKEGE